MPSLWPTARMDSLSLPANKVALPQVSISLGAGCLARPSRLACLGDSCSPPRTHIRPHGAHHAALAGLSRNSCASYCRWMVVLLGQDQGGIRAARGWSTPHFLGACPGNWILRGEGQFPGGQWPNSRPLRPGEVLPHCGAYRGSSWPGRGGPSWKACGQPILLATGWMGPRLTGLPGR